LQADLALIQEFEDYDSWQLEENDYLDSLIDDMEMDNQFDYPDYDWDYPQYINDHMKDW